MIVEQIYATNKPRQNVWCKSSELQPSETSNAYELVDTAAAAKLGDGARIIVIDWPLTVLYWDKTAGVAYNWSDAEGGGKLTTLTADANDTYSPPAGYDGFSEVTVDVQPTLQTLTATANDTYTPDEGYDGFDEVVVNVPNPNSRQTIEGTMAAPFGNLDTEALAAALHAGTADAWLVIAANETLQTPEVPLYFCRASMYELIAASIGGLSATLADCNVGEARWDVNDGSLLSSLQLTGGAVVDMSAYASMLDTTLFVIFHPMT